MKIKDLETKGNIFLAPLAGFTDIGFRTLCRRYGAALSYTEMVSAKGLIYENEKTSGLLTVGEEENPCAVQLFGSNPDFVAEAASRLEQFDLVDINMGCPVPKIVKNGEGSALMKNPILAEKIVAATVKKCKKPVTVKIRKSFGDSVDAVEFAKRLEGAGASLITVHGRTREQFYAGEADWEIIAKVKNALSVPVVGNGDVTDKKSLERAFQSGVDGVMIGRGAIGRPYIFSELQGLDYEYNRFDAAREHLRLLSPHFGERYVVNCMKKHFCRYLKGLRGVNGYKTEIYSAQTIAELNEVIDKAQREEEKEIF